MLPNMEENYRELCVALFFFFLLLFSRLKKNERYNMSGKTKSRTISFWSEDPLLITYF